jgi:4-hydroxy-tetrahydrodipicolinate reductase
MKKKGAAPKLRIAVAGALGRMGRAILGVAEADASLAVVAGWDRPGHADLGRDIGSAAGIRNLGAPLVASAVAEGVDVIVDFSSPESTLATLAVAARAKRKPAVVIGTTGFSAAQLAQVKARSKTLRIVLASNYSVGMNLLWKALDLVARATGDDYDVEVIEAHHHHKKDSPSGTALTTAEVLARALGRDLGRWARYGRPRGNIGARDVREIGLHTVRGGDIVGDHTVLFAGGGERLEFKHQAHSRENFARGALRAGRWVNAPGRGPGLYTMAQVLGFE